MRDLHHPNPPDELYQNQDQQKYHVPTHFHIFKNPSFCKIEKTLTNHEIATLLNISVKTVEAQITIAFKKIKADIA